MKYRSEATKLRDYCALRSEPRRLFMTMGPYPVYSQCFVASLLAPFAPRPGVFAALRRFAPPANTTNTPPHPTCEDIETGTGSTYARLPPSRSRDLFKPDENTRLRAPSDASSPQPGGLTDDGALDCVICCSPVDISDRSGYMLAPCEHIFHRSCLTTWMDVKMECPTCRGNLPAI